MAPSLPAAARRDSSTSLEANILSWIAARSASRYTILMSRLTPPKRTTAATCRRWLTSPASAALAEPPVILEIPARQSRHRISNTTAAPVVVVERTAASPPDEQNQQEYPEVKVQTSAGMNRFAPPVGKRRELPQYPAPQVISGGFIAFEHRSLGVRRSKPLPIPLCSRVAPNKGTRNRTRYSPGPVKPDPTLEISVWDGGPGEAFLGGVCSTSPMFPSEKSQPPRLRSGRYPSSREATRPPVTGISWFLSGSKRRQAFQNPATRRAVHNTLAQGLPVPAMVLRVDHQESRTYASRSPPPGSSDAAIKVQLGFQSAHKAVLLQSSNASSFSGLRISCSSSRTARREQLIVLVEDRSAKEPVLFGHAAAVSVVNVEQRLDERRLVPSKWFNLDSGGCVGGGGNGAHGGHTAEGFCCGAVFWWWWVPRARRGCACAQRLPADSQTIVETCGGIA
ncbi:hypothetical protein HPP92_007492 [Vanilla planifolia]|uniref:Uncharacterized protein n=1 Tax=Vanilla planifolia TaxID=51239 RepID=A0A835RGV2_VANPL|nr:hypothetical protein HPP92_007662 [Vanilla planifolia]KAG0490629.1 hypothetical protein HPP92_007492 [Vanilla planifolia]